MKYDNHTICYNEIGYAVIYLNGKCRKVHILEWEKHNGKKPIGYDIHHLNGNKGDWNIDNLSLETKTDHFRLHAGWIREKGEWKLKPCGNCKKLLPLKEFHKKTGKMLSSICKKCRVIHDQKRPLRYLTKVEQQDRLLTHQQADEIK